MLNLEVQIAHEPIAPPTLRDILREQKGREKAFSLGSV